MAFSSTAGGDTIRNERRASRPGDLAFAIGNEAQPVATFMLAKGDGLVWEARSLLLADADLTMATWPGRGEAMVLVANRSASRACRFEAGSRWGGPIGAFDLSEHGKRLLFPRHALLGTGPGIAITRYGLFGRRAAGGHETDFTMLQAEGNGWLFLSAAGRVLERRLASAEQVTVNLLALAALSATADVDPAETPVRGGDAAMPLVRLTGPGRIWLQTQSYGRQAAPSGAVAGNVRGSGRPSLEIVR